jgi:hypothetical protein
LVTQREEQSLQEQALRSALAEAAARNGSSSSGRAFRLSVNCPTLAASVGKVRERRSPCQPVRGYGERLLCALSEPGQVWMTCRAHVQCGGGVSVCVCVRSRGWAWPACALSSFLSSYAARAVAPAITRPSQRNDSTRASAPR